MDIHEDNKKKDYDDFIYCLAENSKLKEEQNTKCTDIR